MPGKSNPSFTLQLNDSTIPSINISEDSTDSPKLEPRKTRFEAPEASPSNGDTNGKNHLSAGQRMAAVRRRYSIVSLATKKSRSSVFQPGGGNSKPGSPRKPKEVSALVKAIKKNNDGFETEIFMEDFNIRKQK